MKRYNVYDHENNLILEDATSGQVSKEIGIYIKEVQKCAECNRRYKKKYSIVFVRETNSGRKTSQFSEELKRDWDDTCNKIRKILKKYGKTIIITTDKSEYARMLEKRGI